MFAWLSRVYCYYVTWNLGSDDYRLRKGIADEQLAQKEEERRRKQQLAQQHSFEHPADRRSTRSTSSSSVSTISTALSHSPHDRHHRPQSDRRMTTRSPSRSSDNPRKRTRLSTSSSSYSSRSSYDAQRSVAVTDRRNTRRRHSSRSPEQRGRRRSRSEERRNMSSSIDPRGSSRQRQRSTSFQRNTRPRAALNRDDARRYPAASQMSRAVPERKGQTSAKSTDLPRFGRNGARRPSPRGMERSLSPFSKRLALTQAMNMG